jgi:hypothetical protein
VVWKVGAAGQGCEMPFCSKLIIKLIDHLLFDLSEIRILF